MKHVLFITRKAGAAPGGMEAMTRELVSALQCCSDLQLSVVAHRGGILSFPFFFLRACVIALFTRVDTVHAGDAMLSPLLLLLRIIRPGLRRTAAVHGLDVTWSFPFYRSAIAPGLRAAHRIVAISRWTAEETARLGVSADNIVVIPCCISPVPVTTTQRHPTQLLLLQRLVPRKGVAWFVTEVVPGLFARRSDLQIVIAGDGSQRRMIEALVASSPFASHMRCTGEVPEGQKDQLLRESALLVLPNIPCRGNGEGFGMVCLEAGVRGLPVVTARLEGLQDSVIDDVTGVFFTPLSAESAASAIFKALEQSWDEASIRSAVHERFDSRFIASRYVHDIF